MFESFGLSQKFSNYASFAGQKYHKWPHFYADFVQIFEDKSKLEGNMISCTFLAKFWPFFTGTNFANSLAFSMTFTKAKHAAYAQRAALQQLYLSDKGQQADPSEPYLRLLHRQPWSTGLFLYRSLELSNHLCSPESVLRRVGKMAIREVISWWSKRVIPVPAGRCSFTKGSNSSTLGWGDLVQGSPLISCLCQHWGSTMQQSWETSKQNKAVRWYLCTGGHCCQNCLCFPRTPHPYLLAGSPQFLPVHPAVIQKMLLPSFCLLLGASWRHSTGIFLNLWSTNLRNGKKHFPPKQDNSKFRWKRSLCGKQPRASPKSSLLIPQLRQVGKRCLSTWWQLEHTVSPTHPDESLTLLCGWWGQQLCRNPLFPDSCTLDTARNTLEENITWELIPRWRSAQWVPA